MNFFKIWALRERFRRFRFHFRFRENGSDGSGSDPEPPCVFFKAKNSLKRFSGRMARFARIDSQIRANRLILANRLGVPELKPFFANAERGYWLPFRGIRSPYGPLLSVYQGEFLGAFLLSFPRILGATLPAKQGKSQKEKSKEIPKKQGNGDWGVRWKFAIAIAKIERYSGALWIRGWLCNFLTKQRLHGGTPNLYVQWYVSPCKMLRAPPIQNDDRQTLSFSKLRCT